MIPALVNSLLLSRGKSTSIIPGANNFVQPFQPITRRHRLDRSGALVGVERFFPGAVQSCDPFFNNVVLLADFEGTPTMSYIEQSPSHKTITFSNTLDLGSQSNMSSIQAEYGTQSARSNNTTGASAPNSSDFYLSDANSSQFTIEYSFFQTERANNYNAVNRLWSIGQFSFSVRHTAANLDFFYSNDGTTINSTSATGAITSGNMGIWAKYAICKNASGKIRIFVNGVMVTSATPADSTMFHSNLTTGINESAASQTSYLDNIRITKGVCRYDSDSNYTVATVPFPAIACSPTAWNPATVINVSLSNGNLSATHTTITAAGVRASTFRSAGKFYWEITNSVAIGSSDGIGFQTSSGLVNDVNAITNVIVFLGTVTDLYANNNASSLNFGTKTLNDRWGIAVDFDAHLCWFRRNNGSWNTSGPANPATGVGGVAFTAGSYTPFVSFQNATSGEVMTANFGATAFTDTVPSGFTAGWPS